jgi:hypothetical protein
MLGSSMPNLLHLLLRVLAGLAGALLLYVAFFLYEDEEAGIQNRLEQIWQKINALQSSAMSKEVAFLQGVTRTTSAILDRLLGHKLVSLQSISVSMAFSFSSFSAVIYFYWKYLHSDQSDVIIDGVFGVLLLVLGSLPALAADDRSALRTLRPIVTGRSYYLGLLIMPLLMVPIIYLAAGIKDFGLFSRIRG